MAKNGSNFAGSVGSVGDNSAITFSGFSALVGNCHFTVVSYNMHGFNQGIVGTKEIIVKLNPDIIAIQEHWLTPANLYRLSQVSSDYFVCGSSSMGNVLASGPLFGRPFGGTAILSATDSKVIL